MINVGSDFSGVGAFNQALDRLNINYKTVFACDWDKYARQTYIHNYGKPDYYPSDVYDRKIPKESLDIYMTSPPCQAFSLAGKRKGEKDKRGVLFYNSHEFIVKNKPRYFIFENVKGLLSDDSGKTFNRWLDYLGGKSVNGNPVIFPLEDATPYHIYHKVLNAKHYGVPQNRERVFIVGIRDDSDNTFTWSKAIPLVKRLKDVLEDDVDEKYYLSDKMINYLENTKFNQDAALIQKKDICTTLLSSDYKSPKCIKIIGNTNPSGNGMNGNVFDSEGISPTLSTNKGEGIKVKSATKKGYEIAKENDSINLSQISSKTRRGRVGKQVAQTLDTACNQAVMIGAFRGRNPENTNDRTTGAPMQQTLEINKNGTSNTITSVQKDNVIISILDVSHRNEGVREYFKTAPCLNARDYKEPRLINNGFKIRRLTPRECFRLMDFPDTFTWPVSNSQAYKQAGNTIVRAVLANTIEKLNGIT